MYSWHGGTVFGRHFCWDGRMHGCLGGIWQWVSSTFVSQTPGRIINASLQRSQNIRLQTQDHTSEKLQEMPVNVCVLSFLHPKIRNRSEPVTFSMVMKYLKEVLETHNTILRVGIQALTTGQLEIWNLTQNSLCFSQTTKRSESQQRCNEKKKPNITSAFGQRTGYWSSNISLRPTHSQWQNGIWSMAKWYIYR